MKLPNTVHTILKSALKAARDEDRTDPPWHLDGLVRPVCPARGQIQLTVTLAELTLPTAPASDQRQAKQLLAAVRKYLAGKASHDQLKSVVVPKPAPTSALGISYNALTASLTLARGKPSLVKSAAQAAAAKAVKLWPIGAPTRQLLEAIDQEILCLECEAAFGTRAQRGVEQVLWRGADTTKRKTVHWVARLEGGTFAGSFKLVNGKGPVWAEGSLDDVMASAPERAFSAVVKQASLEAAKPTLRLATLRAQ